MKLLLPLFIITHSLHAQKTDSLRKTQPTQRQDKLVLSLYERVISDAKGNLRFDENIVSNLKLNKWLAAEAGIRFGHRPQKFDSYYHYKLELQTQTFFQTVRFFVRLANDVNQSIPVYTRSYYMAVGEVRRPLGGRYSFLAALGQVLAAERDNSLEGSPSLSGTQTNYYAYKVGLRYSFKEKGFMEAMCGNYDVFNPYVPNNSFLQYHFEYDVSRRTSLITNLRYQFDTSLDKPLNYYFITGVRLRFD